MIAQPPPPAARPTSIPRLQLFEIMDQPWLPPALRALETDYLHGIIRLAKGFDPVAPLVAEALAASPARRVVDLCSGGAGPVLDFVRDGLLDAPVTLTDLFPHPATIARVAAEGGGRIVFHDAPVDARDVPAALAGVRTLFDGLHHFAPDDARAILADAARKGVPIVVAEGMHRSAKGLVGALFVPLFVFFVTPLVKPRTVTRFLLTYVFPIAPMLIGFDGLVSCLRTYRSTELLAMTRDLGGDGSGGYTWEAGEIASKGTTITWLRGLPKRTPALSEAAEHA